ATDGVPTVKYFADKICLSSNYFGDLVKQETGKTAQEYIQLKMINYAKNSLLNPALSTKHIAELLGFQHPQHFIRFFKKQTGSTPPPISTNNQLGPILILERQLWYHEKRGCAQSEHNLLYPFMHLICGCQALSER
ncbi:MAG: helix-turn-helix domain-containing protein, partial [Muribaculaceae bacterium]|nr:helix-turn-helix domain-containing protein [Muribaculaceae bacterium]